MPTKPPVAIVSPSRMRLAASSAVTIFPLSSAFTGASVSRTGAIDICPPHARTHLIGRAPTNPRLVARPDAFSVESGQIVERDNRKYRGGFRQRNHKHVLIGLPVGETRHRKQRDHGAIVRQCIHAAARHGRDTMKDIEWDICRMRGGNE